MCGRAGLKDEAELFFLDNALMLLPAPRAAPAGTPRRGSEIGIPGDPGRNVSWPWPGMPEEISDGRGGRARAAWAPVRDPALEEAAALAGGISPEGWRELRAWIPARIAELEKSLPGAAAKRRMFQGGRRFTLILKDLDSLDGDEWETLADFLVSGGDGDTAQYYAETTLPQVGRILKEAPPRDRAWIMREAIAMFQPPPSLKAGDGTMIAALDRERPYPLAAAGVALACLGCFRAAFECLARDSRPWYMANLKANALASVLESSKEEPWLKGRTEGLDRLYSAKDTDKRSLNRLRKALASLAFKPPELLASPPPGAAEAAEGRVQASRPGGPAGKDVLPGKGKGAGSKASRKAKGGKGGKGGGKRR
jgi:hypothetical protein